MERTNTDRQIKRYIDRNPGVHFSGITKELGLAPGQTQYHLRKLLESGYTVSSNLYGRTHYYPRGYDEWEKGAIALLRRETARDILISLLENGESHPEELSMEIGIARSTLEWHVDHLVEKDLVRKKYRGNKVYLEPLHPKQTVKMMREIKPSLSESIIDRFMRLVDNIIEE